MLDLRATFGFSGHSWDLQVCSFSSHLQGLYPSPCTYFGICGYIPLIDYSGAINNWCFSSINKRYFIKMKFAQVCYWWIEATRNSWVIFCSSDSFRQKFFCRDEVLNLIISSVWFLGFPGGEFLCVTASHQGIYKGSRAKSALEIGLKCFGNLIFSFFGESLKYC